MSESLGVYELTCYRCLQEIELAGVRKDVHRCPNCQAPITVEWRVGEGLGAMLFSKSQVSSATQIQFRERVLVSR